MRQASLVQIAVKVMNVSQEAAVEVVAQVLNAYPDLEQGLKPRKGCHVPEKTAALFVCRLLGEVRCRLITPLLGLARQHPASHADRPSPVQVPVLYKVDVLEELGFDRGVTAAAITATFRLPIGPLFNFRPVPPIQLAALPSLFFKGLPSRMTFTDFRLLCIGNRGFRACSMQPQKGHGDCWFEEKGDAEEAQRRLSAVSLSPSAPCPLLVKFRPCWGGELHTMPPAFL